MDSCSYNKTGHHCEQGGWDASVLTETGRRSKMHCTVYTNQQCWLHHAMHNAEPRLLRKY